MYVILFFVYMMGLKKIFEESLGVIYVIIITLFVIISRMVSHHSQYRVYHFHQMKYRKKNRLVVVAD